MKILCVSLGCDKNLVDTEKMLGLLNRDGYTFFGRSAMATRLTMSRRQILL